MECQRSHHRQCDPQPHTWARLVAQSTHRLRSARRGMQPKLPRYWRTHARLSSHAWNLDLGGLLLLMQMLMLRFSSSPLPKSQAACRIAMPAHACAADGVKVRRIILLATVTSAFDLVPSGSGWGGFVRALARFGSNRPGSATTCNRLLYGRRQRLPVDLVRGACVSCAVPACQGGWRKPTKVPIQLQKIIYLDQLPSC